ncbi:hypothetical protein AB4278_16590 [Vibrio splendidus]
MKLIYTIGCLFIFCISSETMAAKRVCIVIPSSVQGDSIEQALDFEANTSSPLKKKQCYFVSSGGVVTIDSSGCGTNSQCAGNKHELPKEWENFLRTTSELDVKQFELNVRTIKK